MNKMVLIQSYNSFNGVWHYLVMNKSFPEMTVEEIVARYRGFEGELVKMSPLKVFNERLSEFEGNSRLLFVLSDSDHVSEIVKGIAVKRGYDVGVCEEDATIYSSIFNEILFWTAQLVEYRTSLNETLLFQTRSEAEGYVELHDKLSALGKGVEDYERMIIYEVWEKTR